ncbi:HAMP domain-containing histidine kinase [Phototrophicus methaneseepsis]|uniref:histidine kinase n=1 Tax=Phototrophicus methaneseepsis TaxID=2710758 RepID=A0A7S8IE73_9CHLR|nr:ATP-binding protein [Phototrophicus methaneseepsis]QPC82306.1 HAMP domain-containing histidine kinase [Phototrophicus methaneseepsis]
MPTANYDKLLEPISDIRVTCESLLTEAFGRMGGDQRESVKTMYASAGGLYALVMDIITSLGLTNVARRRYIRDKASDVIVPLIEESQSLLDGVDGPLEEEQTVAIMFINEVSHNLRQNFRVLWNYSEALHRIGRLNKRIVDVTLLFESLKAPTSYPLNIVYEVVPNVPDIFCDKTRITQALEALIDNVARHSGSDVVHIRASRERGMILITVRDQGNGIPANAMKNVLEPFFQVDTITDGLGLGLPMAAALVSWHQGQMRLKNDNGLVVELYLPIAT